MSVGLLTIGVRLYLRFATRTTLVPLKAFAQKLAIALLNELLTHLCKSTISAGVPIKSVILSGCSAVPQFPYAFRT